MLTYISNKHIYTENYGHNDVTQFIPQEEGILNNGPQTHRFYCRLLAIT